MSPQNNNLAELLPTLLFEMRKKDIVPNVFTYNILLDTFRKRRDCEKTFWVLEQMKKEGCATNDVTVRILGWLIKAGEKETLIDFVHHKF